MTSEPVGGAEYIKFMSMKRIIFNKKSKRFELQVPQLDHRDWTSSYKYMIEYSRLLYEECDVLFGRKSRKSKIELHVNSQVEAQYYVLKSIQKNESWVKVIVQKDSIRAELEELVKTTLANLFKYFDSLSKSLTPKDSKKYTEDEDLSEYRYIKLDNYNRLVYEPEVEYNKVHIISIMFHHKDKTPNEDQPEVGNISNEAKRALTDLFNKSSRSKKPLTELRDYIDSKY